MPRAPLWSTQFYRCDTVGKQGAHNSWRSDLSTHSALLSLFPVLRGYAPGFTNDTPPAPTKTDPHLGCGSAHSIGAGYGFSSLGRIGDLGVIGEDRCGQRTVEINRAPSRVEEGGVCAWENVANGGKDAGRGKGAWLKQHRGSLLGHLLYLCVWI